MPFWERIRTRLDAGSFPMAVEHGDLSAVREILERNGADPNAIVQHLPVAEGTTVLVLAAGLGNTAMATLLLDHGADPNTKDVHGGTALMAAAFNGEEDLVALLIDRGAYLDAMTDSGGTALRLAEVKRHFSVAALLRQRGATDYGGVAAEKKTRWWRKD